MTQVFNHITRNDSLRLFTCGKITGRGVRAVCDGKTALVGNELLMSENKIDVSSHQKEYEALQEQAKTVVFVAEDGKVVGLIALADTLKDYVREAIAELKKMKKEVIMMIWQDLRF